MNWFTNLKTRSKLLATFGMVILLLVITVFGNLTYLHDVYDLERALDDSLAIRNNLNTARVAMFSAASTPVDAKVEGYLQEIAQRTKVDAETIERLENQYRGDSEYLPYVQRMKAARAEAISLLEKELIPLIRQGKKTEVIALILGQEGELIEKYNFVAAEFSTKTDTDSGKSMRSAQVVSFTLGGIAIIAAAFAVYGLTRTIASPLQQITAAAERIAEGDIRVEAATKGREDEIGKLDQAFQRMGHSLNELAGRARQIAEGDLTVQIKARSERDVLGGAFSKMTSDLRRLMQQLLEAVSVLTSSATEIQATTAQLAASAMETASAVTETTATVEEVKQTSQIASQKARQVADEAQRAAETAKGGKVAVEQTVTGMNDIRGQMGTVADSILNLSAQGQAIGEIIASVDDLAAQSKLLAVNAAIEAAKAGEEGKGFAVVAQEVRSLAEQSKQATTQVRGILSDIQKATSSAVLATEQGGKTVEAGVRQAAASGDSIRILADSIAQAAQASMQIAATSQQQYVGMDQVAQAMASIRTASSQGVASTKQTEAAAKQLYELGQQLKQLASRFQV